LRVVLVHRWIKASRIHTLIPRDSDRWRGAERVQLHADLTILAKLSCALARARAAPLAA